MKNSLKKTIRLLLLSIVIVSLSACIFDSSSDDEVDLSGVSTEQAQETMVTTLFNGFDTSLANIDSAIFDSDALTTITENPQIASLLGDNATTLNDSSSVSDLVDVTSLLGEDAGELEMLIPSEDMTDEQYAAQVDQLMTTYFNEPIRNGNNISYTFNSQICTMDETATTQEIAQCTALLSVVSIEQTLTSETSGTVSLLINAAKPITIGYSETGIYIEADLGLIKTALVTLEPLLTSEGKDPIVLPDTFSGAVRLSFNAPSVDSAVIQLGITKAIDIEGMLEDTMLDASIAQSPELLVFTATETSLELSLDLKTTSIVVEDMSVDAEDLAAVEITTGGLMANISMGETGEIVISDTGITGSLSVKTAETESDLATADPILLVTLDEFDATVSADFSSITFDTEFDVALTTDLSNQPLALEITAEADTELTSIVAESGSVPKVVAGSLTLSTSTGAQEMSVTANEGECLGDDGAGFFEVVTCPVGP